MYKVVHVHYIPASPRTLMYHRHLPHDIQWRRSSCKGEGQCPKSQQGVSDDEDLCLGHMTYWELSPGIPCHLPHPFGNATVWPRVQKG